MAGRLGSRQQRSSWLEAANARQQRRRAPLREEQRRRRRPQLAARAPDVPPRRRTRIHQGYQRYGHVEHGAEQLGDGVKLVGASIAVQHAQRAQQRQPLQPGAEAGPPMLGRGVAAWQLSSAQQLCGRLARTARTRHDDVSDSGGCATTAPAAHLLFVEGLGGAGVSKAGFTGCTSRRGFLQGAEMRADSA